MPLRSGYSYDTFRANVAELRNAGQDDKSAIAASFAAARVSFFKAHPQGFLPEWMAYPKRARKRTDYNAAGHPYTFQNNPKSRETLDPRKLASARKLYEDFTGHKAGTLRKQKLRQSSNVGLAIGKVLGIMYEVSATGERFKHMFTKVAARPTLVADHDGQQVQMIGGSYTFTDRGIVDD